MKSVLVTPDRRSALYPERPDSGAKTPKLVARSLETQTGDDMIDEQSKPSRVPAGQRLPRALVVGDGPAGLTTAQALVDLGIGVSLAKSDSFPGSLYCSAPGMNVLEYVAGLSAVLDRVERVEYGGPLQVVRHGNGFLVTSGQKHPRHFGCIVLAPGLPGRSLPAELPADVEPLQPQLGQPRPESIGFLLDFESPSIPALGMAAIAQALANRTAGGESSVFMQHVPVRNLFGEGLYESARRAGVRFFRFADELPQVKSLPDSTGPRFIIVVNDAVEAGESIAVQCDRVVAAVGPDPSCLPSWAVAAICDDTDRAGFLLSSSVHCHPGRSFKGGIFAVGEATGTLDLLDAAAQAAAVAAEARAWLLSAVGEGSEKGKVSVADECCRCLTCFRICPHTAISWEGGAARSRIGTSAAACRECGVCVSECPRQALDVLAFPEAATASFLEEVERSAGSNPLVIYGCRRSAARAVSQTRLPQGTLFFSVPCAGSVSESLLLSTTVAGAGGILVVGCHHGNCASRDGTDWAEARVRSAVAAMRGSCMRDVPVRYATAAANEEARLARVIGEFHDSLRRPGDLKLGTG